MFSDFHVLDVFQTYSMVSHLRWQDSTICRALIGKNCTYVWNRHNQSWQSSVLQSCDGRRHRFHFLYDNVLRRQAMAVEFSGNQWLTLIRSAQVRFPSHLRISTWPPPSCTLYNTFLLHIVQQSPPCLDGLVRAAPLPPGAHWAHQPSHWPAGLQQTQLHLLQFLLRPSSFSAVCIVKVSRSIKVSDIDIDNTTGKFGH